MSMFRDQRRTSKTKTLGSGSYYTTGFSHSLSRGSFDTRDSTVLGSGTKYTVPEVYRSFLSSKLSPPMGWSEKTSL